MKKLNRSRHALVIFLIALHTAASPLFSADPVPHSETQKFEMHPRRTSPLDADLTGGFAGRSNGKIIVAGAEKSSPAQSLAVWFIDADEKSKAVWQPGGLAVPRWAATAQSGESIVCAGGFADGKPVAGVMKIEVRDGKTTASKLADLPKALAGAGACVLGSKLYVVGGASSIEPLVLENELWSLDLAAPDAQWTRETPLPGAGRAFAAVTQQYDTVWVFGGLIAEGSSRSASAEVWRFQPKPPEASLRFGWSRVADIPHPSVGATVFPFGPASVVIAGGSVLPSPSIFPVTGDVADNLSPQIYQTVTDAWCAFDRPLPETAFHVAQVVTPLLTQSFFIQSPAANAPVEMSEFSVVRTVHSLSWIDYLVIVCYFAFISFIGYLASRKQKTSGDFSLAGRNVPWWVAGISMFATGASAISFMAVPALAFSTNLVFLFPIIIYVVAFFVQAYVIYPLLRKMEITSTYEYLERRFNRTLRLIASAQCIIFQTFGRASVVLVLPSLAISATTGISVYASVIVMWIVTTVYSAAGGFQAVVWTDLFQGILKFTAPICMIVLVLFTLPGGWHEFIKVGVTHHKFDYALTTWDATVPAVWIIFIFTFLQGTIMQAGDQPVIQRVFSSPEKEVRRVAGMQAVCAVLIAVVVNFLGLAIYAYFHAHPEQLDPLAQNDKIVPLFVIQALPHGFVGMVIAAIFASAMTTIASSMNSSATVFTEDFFLRIKPDATDKLKLRVLRISSTVVGIIAVSIALKLASMNIKSLMVTWNIISALLGGGIVGVYSLGMFTRRANGFGAVSGAIISVVVTVLVKFYTPLHWQTLCPIAIGSCMLSGYFLSFLSSHAKDLEGLTVFTPKKS